MGSKKDYENWLESDAFKRAHQQREVATSLLHLQMNYKPIRWLTQVILKMNHEINPEAIKLLDFCLYACYNKWLLR